GLQREEILALAALVAARIVAFTRSLEPHRRRLLEFHREEHGERVEFGAVRLHLIEIKEHDPRLLVVAPGRVLDLVPEERHRRVRMVRRVEDRRLLRGGKRAGVVFLGADASRGARLFQRARRGCPGGSHDEKYSPRYATQ